MRDNNVSSGADSGDLERRGNLPVLDGLLIRVFLLLDKGNAETQILFA